jgi:hypothetical protein
MDERHLKFAQSDSFDFHRKTKSNAALKGIRKYGIGCEGVHINVLGPINFPFAWHSAREIPSLPYLISLEFARQRAIAAPSTETAGGTCGSSS